MRYTVVRYVGELVPLNFRRAALAMSREVALQQVQAEELTLLEADNKTSYFGVWFTTATLVRLPPSIKRSLLQCLPNSQLLVGISIGVK